MDAEQIVETLAVARSNVSTSLHELRGFGLVKVVHVMGDRRDHFEAVHEVWDIFICIAEQRKKREIDPTLMLLRDCVTEAGSDKNLPIASLQRIVNMLEFVETTSEWYTHVIKLKRDIILKLMKLGSKIVNFVK